MIKIKEMNYKKAFYSKMQDCYLDVKIKQIFNDNGVEFANGKIMREDDTNTIKFPKLSNLIW